MAVHADTANSAAADSNLLAPDLGSAAATSTAPSKARRPAAAGEPIVIHDARLTVIDKQDVPSQREGVLLVIGTEAAPGENVLADRLVSIPVGGAVKRFRRLKEGDRVAAGQQLAQLDDRLARDDWAIKKGKVAATKADLAAAEKTRDEAKNRYETSSKLHNSSKGTVSAEDVRANKLNWDRYVFEALSKREAVGLAELECNQAETIVGMHQVRSSIAGVVKTIYRKRGEAIKAMEPVFQIHDLSRLRIEGLLDVEYLPRLRHVKRAVVEPALSESPVQTLLGHLQEIAAVAVSKDAKEPRIVSASEDGSVRVWDAGTRGERSVWWHRSPVRALACTPSAAKRNWCVSGDAEGVICVWDLESDSQQPMRTLANAHRGPVTCLAFGPDGSTCASGGEDRDICLWDPATGALRYRFPAGHRAALTSLQFLPDAQLLSAGRDHTARLWRMGADSARLQITIDRRSGSVAHPGASPDGRVLLLDQGKALRLLTLPERLTAGVLENAADATQFTTFALYSPDARLILTAGAADGRLQLWRAPTATTRPYELRQLVARERSPATCAAFAPDGAFAVTGTKDRQVLIWPLPTVREIETQLSAEVTLLEQAVESSVRQVRIWAEVANPEGRLLPGTTVTLTIYP